ncbi:hypothetical protein K7432_002418 [Basidiobolus ranarum]|uniref:CCHC-type domain-containing protein n=1 Tax=Basidiobolus ranarum TaxID=34480 RepID=A0ABR2W7V4_9FUNG
MSSTPLKTIVVGSVHGQIKQLFSKIELINKKNGPFDVLLCGGDFFGSHLEDLEDLVENRINVPVTTYFISGSNAIPEIIQNKIDQNHGEVCSNLFYLGKGGILKTSQGLSIAYLSGTYAQSSDDSDSNDVALPSYQYNDTDVENMLKTTQQDGFDGVDILLTHEWPENLMQFSSLTPSQSISSGSSNIAKVASALKPRYHFATLEKVFFEREPYKNELLTKDGSLSQRVTRFIGLGEMGNTLKTRWFYAMNVVPTLHLTFDVLTTVPPNSTDCPFSKHPSQGKKRNLTNMSQSGNYFWDNSAEPSNKHARTLPPNYVCNKCKQPGHHIRDCPTHAESASQGPPDDYVCKICQVPGHWIRDCPKKAEEESGRKGGEKDPCWFCLSNPKIAKHLIVSIGSELYVTLAKGGLVDANDENDGHVPGGGHALLIPIGHYASFNRINPEAYDNIMSELEKYKKALKDLYEKYGCEMLTFEIAREGRFNHAHVQVTMSGSSIIWFRDTNHALTRLSLFPSISWTTSKTRSFKRQIIWA